MCFASSIVESHKKLFLAPTSESTDNTTNSNACGADKKSATRHNKMLRSKSRLQADVCGDCGASDPSWASINRGILLCSDCCSVHRSLGRHISIVKSLRQGIWEPSVLNFVNSLNTRANSVWEHHLLDGQTNASTKGATRLRKPSPKDALDPTKTEFIKAKHINLSFVLKPNYQDEDNVCSNGVNLGQELSKQLHASVRTSNLETSLRLLVQGADPNFYHEEKCSTPLHVAAKFGQASQIELLLVYGADINAIDGNGLAPLEVAKANNHSTIAERLLDAMYDVTDRIIMFLGGKKPDHASGRHLVIPELSNADISEQLKIARGKLQLVPNKMFEELVMDLYDEVDRRENEAIWATSTMNAENAAVPFLPANPFLSATRNQGRQKLARFSRSEFAGLLTDVLVDARRRQNMANLRPLEANTSVCYAPQTTTAFNTSEHDPNLSDDEPIYDPVASDDDYAAVPPIAQQSSPNTSQESQVEMETLRKQINKYVTEINQLKTEVQKLSTENSHLKSKFSNVPQNATSVYDEPLRIDLNGSENEHPEPHSLPLENSSVVGSNSSSSSSATSSNQSTIKRPASMYERRLTNATGKAGEVCRTTTSMYQMQVDKSQTNFADEVKRRTDLVARCLKELIVNMRDASNKEVIVPCAERIHAAVMELMAIFTTTTNCSATVNETLKSLTHYNVLLQRECENLQKSFDSEDKTAAEKCGKEVRECAYFIAKAVKTLVVYHE